jgi:hypothetical protein
MDVLSALGVEVSRAKENRLGRSVFFVRLASIYSGVILGVMLMLGLRLYEFLQASVSGF